MIKKKINNLKLLVFGASVLKNTLDYDIPI